MSGPAAAVDLALVGRRIVDAHDSIIAPPQPPPYGLIIWSGEIRAGEWLLAFETEGTASRGRAVLIRDRPDRGDQDYFNGSFSWPAMRQDPRGTIELVCKAARAQWDGSGPPVRGRNGQHRSDRSTKV